MQESDKDATFQLSEELFQAAVSPPDLKGRLNVRTDQMLQQEVEDIVEDKRYPFKSVSELVRLCLLIGLQQLREWKPAPTLLGAIKSANALALRDKIQCDSIELIQRLDERIHWYIKHKEFDEAIALVAEIRSYFEGVQEGFWRNHIIKQIDEKFNQWYQDIDNARDKE